MKTCTVCKIEKEKTEFNKNKGKKDGLNNICRECSKERSKRYYNENKEHHKKVIKERKKKLVLEQRQKYYDILKTNSCSDCPESDPVVLEFDHRDDVEKVDSIASMIGSYSWDTILKEMAKCDIRCANCHRKRTAKQQGWYKDLL